MSQISEYDGIVLQLARDRHDYEISRARNLKDKAYGLMQINLVIVGAFATIITFLVEKDISPSQSLSDELIIGIFLLGVSFACLFVVILPNHQEIFSIQVFDENNGNKTFDKQIDTLIADLFASIQTLKENTNGLFAFQFWSIIFLALGTFAMFMSTFLVAMGNG